VSTPSHFVSQNRGHPGLLAGLLGCVFGVLGLFTLAFVFVPIATLCSLVGLIRGMDRGGAAGVGTSLIGVSLCVFGFATSPFLLGITGAIMASNALTRSAPVIQQPTARQQTPQAPAADNPLVTAFKQTEIASSLCRTKRLGGELPSHAASVQCANPAMIQAFNAAHYRYMDLIQVFAEKRLELATKIDRGELNEQQGQLEIQKAYASIQETERRRDSGAR
jgi:hypothetical protein